MCFRVTVVVKPSDCLLALLGACGTLVRQDAP